MHLNNYQLISRSVMLLPDTCRPRMLNAFLKCNSHSWFSWNTVNSVWFPSLLVETFRMSSTTSESVKTQLVQIQLLIALELYHFPTNKQLVLWTFFFSRDLKIFYIKGQIQPFYKILVRAWSDQVNLSSQKDMRPLSSHLVVLLTSQQKPQNL